MRTNDRPDLTICLCCGAMYPLGVKCPQVGAVGHSMAKALNVADVLIARGVTHPTTEDVLEALQEIET